MNLTIADETRPCPHGVTRAGVNCDHHQPDPLGWALSYEERMDTPICVANCVDEMARKIRNAGQSTDVPIVANPPLARALCVPVYMDDPVPEGHYKVVAEVIG